MKRIGIGFAFVLITGCEWGQQVQLQSLNAFDDVRAIWTSSEPTQQIEVKGEATEFGRLIPDGKVDFALVTPSLTRAELLTFDLSALISPQTDRIQVLTKTVDIPSNIALPRQRERYSLFSFELNKPLFRAFVKSPGAYTFSAVRGQFPVREVLNDLQEGKSIFDVINYFNFLSYGQLSVDVQAPLEAQNIPVNQYEFTGRVNVKAPTLASDRTMLALSLSDVDGKLSPVDLKSIKSQRNLDLKTATLGKPYVLALMIQNADPNSQSGMPNFEKLSFSLLPAEHSATPQFLDYVAAPIVTETELQLTPPALPSGFVPLAMYLSFSEIRKVQAGSITTEERTTLWESWAEGWAPMVPRPTINFEKNPKRVYRWEVLFLAQDPRFASAANGDILNAVTHISRNVLEE